MSAFSRSYYLIRRESTKKTDRNKSVMNFLKMKNVNAYKEW